MLTHLSLFSGIGGLDLAAEWAGIETIGQCEWAEYQRKVLEKHWPEVPKCKDIRELTRKSFYERTGRRTVDIISGGFPCQPHSVIGKRLAENDERHLWPEFARIIRELRPKYIIGENVNGILSTIHESVCTDLEKEGYKVRTYSIPACSVGAHHERYRVCIIGISTSKPGLQADKETNPKRTKRGTRENIMREYWDYMPGSYWSIHNPRFVEWLMGFPIGWGDINNTKK